MSKKVILRKSGNSMIFTVPSDLKDSLGKEFTVTKRSDGSVLYTPVKHHNVFDSSEFKNHDFQADLHNDPELSELKPVGKEKLDD
ncbi:hypothetical protein [Companilactobacillus sp. HBUAS59699]|uniref:hypothetical protein n=1 Tax=Companilactobacillus sp. HBUAS59699 TaxID=3109358 RepID=UPI002FF3D1FE